MLVPDATRAWLSYRTACGDITPRTRKLLTSRLTLFDNLFSTRAIGSITQTDLQVWGGHLGHLSQASRRHYLSTLHGFFRWAVENKMIDDDPTKNLPPVKEPRRAPRARTTEQIAAIRKACRNPREHAILSLMLQMGLRCIEVANLQMADWDRQNKTMLIRGKGGNERVLPVPEPAAERIDEYRATLRVAAGPMICDMTFGSHPCTPQLISKCMSNLLKRAGVKQRGGDGVTTHTLRHTALSDVLDRCGNVRIVQEMAGHQSLATTQIYLRRASLDQLRQAMEGRDYSGLPLGGVPSPGAVSPEAGDTTESIAS